jgi:S-adenosylmethionine:tRNA ribosyltransferase-isomerase
MDEIAAILLRDVWNGKKAEETGHRVDYNQGSMKTSDFDYELPNSLIAQTPVEPRDSSRLMVLHRNTGAIEHSQFSRIGQFLLPGDLLVINQTRVIPARIFAHKKTGGKVEILLLRREDLLTWECLVGGKGLVSGTEISIDGGPSAEIMDVLDGSRRSVLFNEPVESFISSVGHVPLPPYIHEPLRDPERYQTIYSCDPGSAAAPTAGLHFTNRLMDELQSKGINFGRITLHVGLDTFAPVSKEKPEDHLIHTEWCEIPPSTAEVITAAHKSRKRVIAVGTTSVRTIESATEEMGNIQSFRGFTKVFILPGYHFKLVDAMITNFHLPKSTLLMLVCAFAGYGNIMHAYEIAIEEGYRFYSFGDAMLII